MLSQNIAILRKLNKMSQEQLAEKLDVSRQSIAKWEKGEVTPELNKLIKLKDIFDVTLDELIKVNDEKNCFGPAPKGKSIHGWVIIDENNCIKLPKDVLEKFCWQKGQELLILGDEGEGIALVNKDKFMKRMDELYKLVK